GHHSGIMTAYRDQTTEKPVAKHFLAMQHHLPTLKFIGIDHVPPLVRGGDRSKMLLQREAYWIHHLDTVTPKGADRKLRSAAEGEDFV
ncbi:Hypothetical predicted protein, partial [Pelobates cultripes]